MTCLLKWEWLKAQNEKLKYSTREIRLTPVEKESLSRIDQRRVK
jgi:hypothetical protein